MEKQIKDYLHLYPECELSTPDGVRKMLSYNPFFNLVYVETNPPAIAPSKAYFTYHIDAVKPILRRLLTITEDEKSELWELIFKRSFPRTGKIIFRDDTTLSSDPRFIMMSGVERLGIELNGTVWADSDLHLWKHNQHEVTHYLLSKGFDLFNLIDEGLAIDAESITSK